MKRSRIIIAASAVALLLVLALAFVFIPRGFEPTAADLEGVTQGRPGYEWRTATFGGLNLVDSEPASITLGDQELPLSDDFTIRRALMRRSVPILWPHLVLLELPDWIGWDYLKGRPAWFEVSLDSGQVSRVIVSEKPQ